MARRFLAWSDVAGLEDTIVKMDTAEIARIFNVPKEAHIAIVEANGFEQSANASSLHIQVDRDAEANTQAHEGIPQFPAVEIGASGGQAPLEKALLLRAPSGEGYQAHDRPAEPIEVFDQILFAKTTTHTWVVWIDFLYVRGPMNWQSEMADLKGEIRQISPEKHAGGQFFQPEGRFKQVGGIGGR